MEATIFQHFDWYVLLQDSKKKSAVPTLANVKKRFKYGKVTAKLTE